MNSFFFFINISTLSILSNINIYIATVADRMHHLDLGLFYYQIDYTRKIIKAQHEDSLLEEMDHRLAAIPHYSSLKIFSNNLKSIARLTASKYHNLMKVIIFIVDNLYEKNTKNIENFIKNNDLTELYKKWINMYMLSRYKIFKKNDLDKLKVYL